MRIISGKYGSRRVVPPSNLPVRPTTDRAREALFNVLHHRLDFQSESTLDLFCGTGMISFEFISRGVTDATAVDISGKCIAFVKKTATLLAIEELHAIKSDVFRFLKKESRSYSIIFADPPYSFPSLPLLPDTIFSTNLLQEGGIFILEHGKEHSFSEHPYFSEQRMYGHVCFSFFEKKQG